MIRFVLRFLGLLALALGFIFLVYDGTKSIADQTVYISSVESTWWNIHQRSLTARVGVGLGRFGQALFRRPAGFARARRHRRHPDPAGTKEKAADRIRAGLTRSYI